jgi:hypothetical protein
MHAGSLAVQDPHKNQIVELRYFGGLTVEETAEFRNLSHGTLKRENGWQQRRGFIAS